MHETVHINALAAQIPAIVERLRQGERVVIADDDGPVGALVSLWDLESLDETDAVLADKGLLEALREAQGLASEPPGPGYET